MKSCPLSLAAALSLVLLTAPCRADPVLAAVSALPLERLKSTYLACDRASSQAMLDAATFSRCAMVGETLLRRGFDGDFERLIAWWRAEKERGALADANAATRR